MIKKLLLILGISIFISTGALAEDGQRSAKTYTVAYGSSYADHSDFDIILRGVVLPRESIVAMIERLDPRIGTRISPRNQVPKGYDINYVPYSIVTEDFKIFVTANKFYIEDMSKINPATLGEKEQMAYWFNLRNALVLDLMFENYPIRPAKLQKLIQGEAWRTPLVSINGTAFSINDIEELVIRTWTDPRVIYGFFYGTHDSPFLMNVAFTGENVVDLLESNAKNYLNASGTLKISRNSTRIPAVFDWHNEVFGGDYENLRAHLESYLEGRQLSKFSKNRQAAFDFQTNWTLNDIPKQIIGTGQNRIFVYGAGIGCVGIQTSEGCDAGAIPEFTAFHSHTITRQKAKFGLFGKQ